MPPTAEELVAGPRGRRFLVALASCLVDPPVFQVRAPRPPALRENIRAVLARVGPEALAAAGAEEVVAALGETTGVARYWQEPDDEDVALADAELAPLLVAVAEAVLRAPAVTALAGDLDRAGQVETVVRYGDEPELAEPVPAASALARWRDHVLEDERRAAAERPADLSARYSGEWWSKPWAPRAVLVETAARWSDGVPLRLLAQEDDFAPQRALVRARSMPAGLRVLELRDPADWAGLVERYPLEVTASRRHDWWRATGVDSRWYLPDYAAAARTHDAIHLSPLAYLLTAGRPLPVLDGAALLAGWDPDATFWLVDLPEPNGVIERWTRDHDDDRAWHRDSEDSGLA